MNLGALATAMAMGIAAIGSAIGIGTAGQASIGAKVLHEQQGCPLHPHRFCGRTPHSDHLRLPSYAADVLIR